MSFVQPEVQKPPENGVCAVVVTFRPDATVARNLAETRAQVQGLIAVDNGSSLEALALLRCAGREHDFELIENQSNTGLAAALNVGVRRALSHEYRWILLLDQDARVTDGFVAQMLADFARESAERNVLLLVPRNVDPNTGAEWPLPLAEDGGPLITITSGSLFAAAAFNHCGFFEEKLFIYTIDDEYSLRIRSKGYSIAQSKTAVLLHSPGFPSIHRFFGVKFVTSNHSPGARYYLNRNRVWMLRAYGSRYPQWARDIRRATLVEFVKIVLAERSRWLKVKMIVRGIRDGLMGRMGQTVRL